jgi:hypothetical protein
MRECQGHTLAPSYSLIHTVSGGTDVGIMHFVGEAKRKFVTDVPTIGFATWNMINNRDLFKKVCYVRVHMLVRARAPVCCARLRELLYAAG